MVDEVHRVFSETCDGRGCWHSHFEGQPGSVVKLNHILWNPAASFLSYIDI